MAVGTGEPIAEGHFDASVYLLQNDGADQVLAVIGELGAAQAQPVEGLDIAGALELVGILQPEDDRDLPRGLGTIEVGGGADEGEQVGLAADEERPGGEIAKRILLGVEAPDPDRIVEAGDAGRPELAAILFPERRVEEAGAEIHLERRQHVEDERLMDHIEGKANAPVSRQVEYKVLLRGSTTLLQG